MASIIGSVFAPFLLAWLFSKLLPFNVVWKDFIVHGEAALVAIIVMASAVLLITRERRMAGAVMHVEDHRSILFPDLTAYTYIVGSVFGLAIFVYCAAIVAPQWHPPIDLRTIDFFVYTSILLLLASVFISGVIETVGAVLEPAHVNSILNKGYQDLTKEFEETES